MEVIVPVLQALNAMSPLGIIALLGLVIFMLVKAKEAKTDMSKRVTLITDNHLHEMPELVETARQIAATLQRMEVKMGEEFAYIRARLNGSSTKR